METPESIRASLIPGVWVSLIVLADAYLHIPISPNSRKYLRFCHRSQVFQFTSLPFKLATTLQVLTGPSDFTSTWTTGLHMRPFLFHLKEISSVVGQPPSLDRNHFSTPRMVAESHKRDERCRPSSKRPQYPTLYRRLK